MPADKNLTTACPNCGTASLRSTIADGSGALALDGTETKKGDRIHVCDSCGVIADNLGKPKPATKNKAKAKAKRSRSKPKRATSTTRRTSSTSARRSAAPTRSERRSANPTRSAPEPVSGKGGTAPATAAPGGKGTKA